MPDIRLPEFMFSNPRIGMTYVDAPVNYLADLSIKPVTYNPPPGTGVPRREGNYRFFDVRVHNARPYVKDLSLDRQAFILTHHDTRVRNFYDEAELKAAYYAEVGVGKDRFREIAEKSMHDRAVLNNPRPIKGPAEVMEILELAA